MFSGIHRAAVANVDMSPRTMIPEQSGFLQKYLASYQASCFFLAPDKLVQDICQHCECHSESFKDAKDS